MKPEIKATLRRVFSIKAVAWAALGILALHSGAARASIAYGSINNFDTVNDTGSVCHGFEIELDDIHSTDITYTYDYNHYGAPNITEDNTDPAHPKVFVRYASAKNIDGSWAAFTAIPSAPIAPTMGHQFTNPSVNFGGEHFGVGYRANPSNIVYNWLVDNGSGVLVHGGAVSITTPVFAYSPAAAGVPAQLQAAIVPPPPPAPPVIVYEFGHPSWVKEIRTTTHNNSEVKLRDLVSDDPANPPVKSWRNGEPDEVEMEWQLMQTDSGQVNGGANGGLQGAAEKLNHGDEVITRRYEFYEYTGPIDPETHEALAGSVGTDGIHGIGTALVGGVSVDLTTVAVVGKYLGAQMSAADAMAPVGLIDHLPDGEINTPYTDRTVVIAGNNPFVATTSGALPDGLSFDTVTGIVSGTPTVSGTFSFTVNATAGTDPAVTKSYTLNIAAAGAVLPPHSLVDTGISPVSSGTTTGDGSYDNGSNITVTAAPSAGYAFLNWTDNGAVVSQSPSYTFTTDVNRTLTANFIAGGFVLNVTAAGGTVTKSPDQAAYATGTVVTLTATADGFHNFTGWSGDASGATNPLQVTMGADKAIAANFAGAYALNITAVGGAVTKSPDQAAYAAGTVVTLTPTAAAGNLFDGWSGDAAGHTNPLQVTMSADKNITAAFPLYVPLTVTPGAGPNGTISPNTPQIVNSGDGISFTAAPALGGYGVDQWTLNGVSVQSGGTSFTLANVTASQSVNVTFKKAVPVLDVFAPGPWTPGAAVTDLITAQNNPTKFTVTGLPPGVVLNASTGQLGGRPIVAISAATTYPLVITATNATGVSAPLKVNVVVQPLPAPLVGAFNGLVDRDAGLGGGLGGTINVVTTLTGSYTGKLTLGALIYPFTGGSLSAAVGANATSTLVIKRSKPLPPLTLAFSIDKTTGELSGTVTDGVIATAVNLGAWKASVPAAKIATTYTTALKLDPALAGTATTAGNVIYPQGEGFGTLSITSTGAVTWAGQMADGSIATESTTVGPNGEVPLHFTFFTGTGAAHGWVTATADSVSAPTNGGHALLDGTLDWNKNVQPSANPTRIYKNGFPLHQLTAIGGEYVKPGAGQFVIGLLDNSGGNNARFVFSEGGLSGPAPIVGAVGAADLNKAFRIAAATAAVTLPRGTLNPATLTLNVNPKNGAFSGGFVLKGDPDPTKPAGTVARSARFFGLLVPRLGVQQGVGWFLLGELPSAGPPKTTPGTSPVLSGQVLIEAGP